MTLDTQDRADCAVLAALLAGQGALARWSLWLSALSLATLCLGPATGSSALLLAAAALLGLPERYLVFRLRLDQRLFDALATGRIPDLQTLDRSLAQTGLRAASANEPRPLDNRLHGTRRLLRRHAGIVALQSLLLIAAVAARLAS
ncbi:MAG: hypothetical protein QM586_07095 [Xenophilus sp.]